MAEPRALIIDVDTVARRPLLDFLQTRGYHCVAVAGEQVLQAVAEGSFAFTIVDLARNGAETIDVLQSLKIHGHNSGPIIGIVDSADEGAATVSLPLEAVLRKPLMLDDLEQALDTLMRVPLEPPGLAPESAAARIQHEMELWCSPRMLEACRVLREAARVDVTVLATGETGTGKDLVARAIHHFSSRRGGPYVKVNCAAMPRELLESELFGYERGAFTGAHKLKIGKFEAAHRGTIFLDEIGDLHPALQAKLLHVLQDGEFSRIGAKSTLHADVRVLAATNQDLERAVAEGRFREDLYYRLNVIHIVVPPLRERVEEIPVLANYFVKRYARLYGRDGFAIPAPVMDRMVRHRYPGNVRELENLIKRMIVLDDPFLAQTPLPEADAADTRAPAAPSPAPTPSLKEIGRRASMRAEREAIARTLTETGWNRVRAAKALRISYRALLYKIKQAGLDGERA